MKVRFRPSMYVVAAALLGLIGLLATLQYRWLGQVSTAERERMRTNLAARSSAFAQDFDRELTRAYLLFQVDTLAPATNVAAAVADRYDRWQASSRYPRLVRDIFIVGRAGGGEERIQRFNPTTRFLEPVAWPEEFQPIRAALAPSPQREPAGHGTVVVRNVPAPVWEGIPALVIPMPAVLFNTVAAPAQSAVHFRELAMRHELSFSVVSLDREYVSGEMLPALAQQHFRGAGEGIEYDVAVVSSGSQASVFTTDAEFSPEVTADADGSANLFQVRLQEFSAMASEIRRFTSFLTTRVPMGTPPAGQGRDGKARAREVRGVLLGEASRGGLTLREGPPLTIMLQQSLGAADRRAIEQGVAAATVASRGTSSPAHWRLMVRHPAGSLEAAVSNARQRNLVVSSGILAVLGASVGFLLVSTRRAQDLARQQMEFVAAVSHELRTPLAVIRSAADNLAEGVVSGEGQIRKYGELVRGEGRRLSEMVEQILELAGIHSGQRSFALRPVPWLPLIHDVLRASAPLVDERGIAVEISVPETLPPVLGDEAGLRRVVQNLVGNAIKYGGHGRWIGISARTSGREVLLTIADRGIGIPAAEQENIFKPFYRTPDVVAAQIQGAGLGLSLVQRTVSAHGGGISVESTPGQGSAFTIRLPAASEQPAVRTASAADPATSGAR